MSTLCNLHTYRQVAGFDYEISEFGVVRSLPRVIVRSNGRPQTVRARELRPGWTGQHWQVGLKRDKKTHRFYVHNLVLEAFVCPRPEGMKGLHRDDDPHNNHVSNLYWGTMQDNAFDRVRNGNDHNARKIECKRGHLLEAPNLAPWGDVRCCLACNRAKTLARWRGFAGDEDYVQKLADEKFAEITGSEVVL